MIDVTATIAIHERELDERFVRASGPGGGDEPYRNACRHAARTH